MDVVICMGSSCFARGNEENLRVIERFIEENNGHAAGGAPIELSGKCCLGKCAEGPNVVINEQCHHRMDKGKLIDLFNELSSEQPVVIKTCPTFSGQG